MRHITKLIFLVIIFLPEIITQTFMEFFLRKLIIAGSRNEWEYNNILFPKIVDGVKRQRSISRKIPFPCDTTMGRSKEPPSSVHRLRPGDIDVISGLGDSLVAASGALEEFAIGTFIEARGVSWCAGGQDNWRKYFTIPNLIKEYNKNLTGYATGTGEFISTKAGLNIAYPVAATEDALHQAKILVNRMRNNPNIDIKRHWKLITLFFGANDICSAQCYNWHEFSPMKYALHLKRALDYLRSALPRTLINLVPTIDVTVSVRVNRSTMCNLLHPLYCACLHRGKRPDITASKIAKLYQQAAEVLIASKRYDTTIDFTVVLQPFMAVFNAKNSDPKLSPPLDSNLVTYDCFHFSQKGHALVANLLWNNMFEPVGNKSSHRIPKMMDNIICPNEKTPFIFTNINSRYYYETGFQNNEIN